MKRTYLSALGIAAAMIVWFASGQLGSEPADPAAAPAGPDKPLRRVRTLRSEAEPRSVQIVARGRTEAKRIVEVRAETSGRVVAVPIEKGTLVEAGDVLCRLAVEDREMRLAEARSSLKSAELEYQGALRLAKDGYQSEVAIARAETVLTNARAEVRARELDLDYLNIRAPFDAVVQDRTAELGDFIQRGGVCAEVLDPDPMLMVVHVSEREVGDLQIGAAATAELTDRDVHSGRISFISHAADPITRTYRIEVEMSNPDLTLRDGLSADVYLPHGSVLAHRVSPALLSLNDEGNVGIKILDPDNRVRFVEVNVVSDTQTGVWLSGLPENIRLITLGHELVFPGQEVEPVPEDLGGVDG
jgi:multidrug efflux system membrane fusion protein